MTESNTLKKQISRWGPVVLWMGLIFFLSAQPTLPRIPALSQLYYGDKIMHAIAYSVLACLTWRALFGSGPKWRQIVVPVALALAYGLSDELHQLYVPGRSFDMLDLSADVLGAAIAAVLLTIYVGGDEVGARTARLRSEGQEKAQP